MRSRTVLLAIIVLGMLIVPPSVARAQSQPQAQSQIAQAYAAVRSAQQKGGNVTSLVAQLNSAISLVQQGDSVNATDPARAQSLYAEASAIAQQVLQAAPGVGQAGAAARQLQEALSIGAAGAVVVFAALLYLYGERIYHRFWLWAYSGYTVKKVG